MANENCVFYKAYKDKESCFCLKDYLCNKQECRFYKSKDEYKIEQLKYSNGSSYTEVVKIKE